MPPLKQPVTDNSIQVRQLTHYQFTWIAGKARARRLDTAARPRPGAWEEVLTLDADDADNLQDLLSVAKIVHYDIKRRTLMFRTTPVGSS